MALIIPNVVLLGLALWGFWTLWGFPYNNGLLKILKSMTEPGALIPGPTAAPMRHSYTGIGPVDKQLTVLVSFFYTATDGNRGDVSLQGLDLGGQVLAAWVLITIESLRSGNKGKWFLTSTTVFGVLVAIVGFAVVAPLWYAIHLWTSPTAVDPRGYQLLVDSPLQLAIAPFSIIAGFGIPSVIMSLPAPAKISFDIKQLWTGIQQGWPIWIALVQIALTILVSGLKSSSGVLTGDDQKTKTMKYIRQAYAFALLSSAGAHLTAWGISLLAFAFPILFTSPYVAQLQPANVFLPVSPFAPVQAQTLADGALWFLQWDLITGTAATLLWALTLRTQAKHETATFWQWVSGLTKVGIIAAMVGPCGAAVIAVWSRDELVFRRSATADTGIAKKGKAD